MLHLLGQKETLGLFSGLSHCCHVSLRPNHIVIFNAPLLCITCCPFTKNTTLFCPCRTAARRRCRRLTMVRSFLSEVTGAALRSSSCRAWATPWDWVTCGGSPTSASKTEEVRSLFLTQCISAQLNIKLRVFPPHGLDTI